MVINYDSQGRINGTGFPYDDPELTTSQNYDSLGMLSDYETDYNNRTSSRRVMREILSAVLRP